MTRTDNLCALVSAFTFAVAHSNALAQTCIAATGVVRDTANVAVRDAEIVMSIPGQTLDKSKTDEEGVFLLTFFSKGHVDGQITVLLQCDPQMLCKPYISTPGKYDTISQGRRKILIHPALKYYPPPPAGARLSNTEASERIEAIAENMLADAIRQDRTSIDQSRFLAEVETVFKHANASADSRSALMRELYDRVRKDFSFAPALLATLPTYESADGPFHRFEVKDSK